jgi:dipeptidyl aminopeptidase/acylaminoacyl peptidase
MSERSGWNHLYLVDRNTGQTSPITAGEWVVRGVDHMDPDTRQLWFRVAGIHPGQDPYYIHHARINFDGSGLTLLTEANGTHEIHFSPDRKFHTDTWSRADQPPVHGLHRSSDGKKVADLGRADAAGLLTIHPHLPEPFAARGRDGTTDIFGIIFRPSHFDLHKKYPVIEKIYAGPHGQFVPKGFKPFHGSQRLAELGFIVVQIDGMGTNWRSKQFHDVCWKNLKDAGFPDRMAWMKAAAQQYPQMDLSRVGIYGGSAGGQSAMRAVLDHADFYKAAAADCGYRMDKIWWNEAWMGWPVDDSYAQSSNVDDAHKLDGKLLLTVGMLDRNVDPSSTMQVVDALIKADQAFEFIPFPSLGHGAGDSAYGKRRREEFFVQHLMQ